MMSHTVASPVDREALVAWYQRNRRRSSALFDLITDEAYYARPIELRHPPIFYEGHMPAFSFNTLVKKGLGLAAIDERLENLFARGIDPHESQAQVDHDPRSGWPTRREVRAFVEEADRRVLDALENGEIDQEGHPLLDRAEAAFAILEHEAIHHETLLYMWQRLPWELKRCPEGYAPVLGGAAPTQESISVGPGMACLGINVEDRAFSWDNERPATSVQVPGFQIDRYNVTNAAFLEFVESGAYQDRRWWTAEDWAWLQRERWTHPIFWEELNGAWMWRGMFELLPLAPAWPVFVTHAEAAAFARWKSVRLPTEAEYQRAAYGSPSEEARAYPWGNAKPDASRGVFDLMSWDPQPTGCTPAGASAWGVEDLVGNGWEWTSTPFAPFAGFTPIPSYPEYSADFFDSDHFVLKGASTATARELLRPSFRNWFRPRYPYVYATFRCVHDE